MVWTIRTFGGLDLSYGGESYGSRLSQRSKALLAFLALRHGKNVRREEIVNVLWATEYDKTHQRRLSTLLWRLKHVRDCNDKTIPYSVLHVDRSGDVRIEPDSCTWIDLATFDDIFKAIPLNLKDLSKYDVSLIERAVDLYRGDILQDMDVEWVTETRNHSRQRYLDMLHILVDHFSRQNALDKVITYSNRYLRVDPYVEHMHVALINAYLLGGRRALAAASAEACHRVIVDDLGVALSPEAEGVMSTLLRARRNKLRSLGRPTNYQPSGPNSVGQLRTSLIQLLNACSAVLEELQPPDGPGAEAS